MLLKRVYVHLLRQTSTECLGLTASECMESPKPLARDQSLHKLWSQDLMEATALEQ